MTPSAAEQDAYNQLCCYTLAHGSPSFVHQHVVDAFAAQYASAESKPIGVAFALVGLYLHVEKTVSGRQVQLVHMQLARKKREWPRFDLPRERGAMTATDVMTAPHGCARDAAIGKWCHSVWTAFRHNREAVVKLLREHRLHE
jgi:hypothetical protein